MNKNIINIAILGGAGFVIYKNWDKIKKALKIGDKTGDQSSLDEKVADNAPATGTTNIPQNDSYKKKVSDLQTLLKIGVDGAVGKQTNGALENLYSSPPLTISSEVSYKANYPYLRKNGKGAVNSSNIDYYIAALTNKTTPNDLYYKNKAQTGAVQDASKKIQDAYKKGGTLVVKSAITTKKMVYDNAAKNYVPTQESITFKSMQPVGNRASVKIVALAASGRIIVEVQSSTWGSKNYFLTFEPSNIIVQ